MKLGVSTWCLLNSEVNSAIRAIGDAGFDFVEVWGEVPHAYHDWSDRRTLKDTLSSYSMAVTLHAPFTDLNPAAPFQPVKGAVAKSLNDFAKFGEFLGASIITVHPGSVHNEGLVPQSTENSVALLRGMVKQADGRLIISIENQTRSRSKYHFPLASTFESVEVLLAEVEGARFTLDTGHAHVNGHDPLALAERVGPKLVEVHLSDNGGAADDHLIPGEGNASLKPLLDRVADTEVLVCFELDPHRYSEEQVLKATTQWKSDLDRKPVDAI
ncbi:MAG: sugar phosphate isomerase/epimerase [Thaumarchaeota archaeon]|nr:sugar phosphate isomerase/epimerase [Nitrososphaerota archaeon]